MSGSAPGRQRPVKIGWLVTDDRRPRWRRAPAAWLARAVARNGFRQRLRTPVEELDRARLEARYRDLDCTPIAEAPLRRPVRLGGEIQGVTVVPRADSPSLEVTIADGSGAKVVAVFLGRRRIGGLSVGHSVSVEGVLQEDRHRLMLLNPSYQLLA